MTDLRFEVVTQHVLALWVMQQALPLTMLGLTAERLLSVLFVKVEVRRRLKPIQALKLFEHWHSNVKPVSSAA